MNKNLRSREQLKWEGGAHTHFQISGIYKFKEVITYWVFSVCQAPCWAPDTKSSLSPYDKGTTMIPISENEGKTDLESLGIYPNWYTRTDSRGWARSATPYAARYCRISTFFGTGRNLGIIYSSFLMIWRSKKTKECKVVCLVTPNCLIADPEFKLGLPDLRARLYNSATRGPCLVTEVCPEGSTLNRPD